MSYPLGFYSIQIPFTTFTKKGEDEYQAIISPSDYQIV